MQQLNLFLESDRLLTLIKDYFEKFGDKACCFEDLKPYMDLDQDNLAQFSAVLESVPKSFVSLHEAFRNASHYTPDHGI